MKQRCGRPGRAAPQELIIPCLACLAVSIVLFGTFHAVSRTSVLMVKTELREATWKVAKQQSSPVQASQGGNERFSWRETSRAHQQCGIQAFQYPCGKFSSALSGFAVEGGCTLRRE